MNERVEVVDPVAHSDYVVRWQAQTRQLRLANSSWPELIAAARRAQVVLLGEYHPLESACSTATRLIAELTRGSGSARGVLGLEMVHARDQHVLDDYLARRASAPEFLRRIRYREEWGYPWGAVRRLLEVASRRKWPVYGLDTPPRGGVDDLELRDEAAAERLVRRLQAAPLRLPAIVIFGEAHVADDHLPRQLIRQGLPARQILQIFHDLEHLEPDVGPGIRRSGEQLFVIQSCPHGARERALRRTYRAWTRTSLASPPLDLRELFDGIVAHLAAGFGLDPRTVRVAPGVRLVDLLPEVTFRSPNTKALRSPSTGSQTIAESLTGWSTDTLGARVHASRPGLRAAAIEAGRFLARYWRGQVGTGAEVPRDPVARITEQALAVAIAAWRDAGLRRLGVRCLVSAFPSADRETRRMWRASTGLLREIEESRSMPAGLKELEAGSTRQDLEFWVGARLGIDLARRRPTAQRLMRLAQRSLATRQGAWRVLRAIVREKTRRGP